LGYGADAVLGLDGSFTRTLQTHLSRLAADVSFAKAREHLTAILPVTVTPPPPISPTLPPPSGKQFQAARGTLRAAGGAA